MGFTGGFFKIEVEFYFIQPAFGLLNIFFLQFGALLQRSKEMNESSCYSPLVLAGWEMTRIFFRFDCHLECIKLASACQGKCEKVQGSAFRVQGWVNATQKKFKITLYRWFGYALKKLVKNRPFISMISYKGFNGAGCLILLIFDV